MMAVNFTQGSYILLTLHNGMNQSIEEGFTITGPGEEGAESKVKLHNLYNNSNIMSSTQAIISSGTLNLNMQWSSEMGTTTLHPVTESATSSQDHNMAPLGLLTILILAVIGNITVCLVVRIDQNLHNMTYYFFVSLAVVHLLMVAVVMPPAILIILAGKYSCHFVKFNE